MVQLLRTGLRTARILAVDLVMSGSMVDGTSLLGIITPLKSNVYLFSIEVDLSSVPDVNRGIARSLVIRKLMDEYYMRI